MMCLNVDFEVLVNRFVNCAVPTHPVLFSSVHIEQAFFFFSLWNQPASRVGVPVG